MLEEIRIESLGVIDSSTLELGPGLTVISGETGAGKTMIVTALGLLLGGRADSGAVRTGATTARVEGTVTGDADPDLPERVDAVDEPRDGAVHAFPRRQLRLRPRHLDDSEPRLSRGHQRAEMLAGSGDHHQRAADDMPVRTLA